MVIVVNSCDLWSGINTLHVAIIPVNGRGGLVRMALIEPPLGSGSFSGVSLIRVLGELIN